MSTYEQLPLFDPPTDGEVHPWPRPAVVSERPKPLKGKEKAEAVMNHLVSAGYLPVRCKGCGVFGHASADCPTRAEVAG